MGNLTCHVGQTKVTSGVSEGKTFVIHPHQVQDRGVQVVDVHAAFDGAHAELVRGAVCKTALDAASGHPHGETVVVVVSTGLLGGDVRRGCPAKFSTPQNERLVQHAARLQVRQQRGNRLVALEGLRPMIENIGVIVSRDVRCHRKLHDADTSLRQPPCYQSTFGKTATLTRTRLKGCRLRADAVQIQRGLHFA